MGKFVGRGGRLNLPRETVVRIVRAHDLRYCIGRSWKAEENQGKAFIAHTDVLNGGRKYVDWERIEVSEDEFFRFLEANHLVVYGAAGYPEDALYVGWRPGEKRRLVQLGVLRRDTIADRKRYRAWQASSGHVRGAR